MSAAELRLAADRRVSSVTSPSDGVSISADGSVAMIEAGAAASPNEMVRAADELKESLAKLGTDEVAVHLTGASGMWSDFNEANKQAMMKSELISWPSLSRSWCSLSAHWSRPGCPCCSRSSACSRRRAALPWAQITDISIWAMNFALMFALALGIDYALFVVYRFRAAFFGSKLSGRGRRGDNGHRGKAVLFSGLTVLISLTRSDAGAEPAFRSMSLGIMLAVIFVMAATLTLLPAVLAKLGPRVDKLALPWVHSGEHRSARFAAWGERSGGGRCCSASRRWGCFSLSRSRCSTRDRDAVDQGVPAEDGSRLGYERIQAAFGPGAPGALQSSVRRARSTQPSQRPGETPASSR